ncbi:MAG: SRPBCC family protein [Eubacteriales bacterium]
MVKNIHTRDLLTSPSKAGVLIDSLASKNDKLWPRDQWPPILFDRPLGAGAAGGHGPIRYVVEEYKPGRHICFRFTEPGGFIGTHAFDVEEVKPGMVRLRHVIDMRVKGIARIIWPLMIRWLHDALIEDAFDRAEAYVASRSVSQRRWPFWVRFLRGVYGRKSREKVEDGSKER